MKLSWRDLITTALAIFGGVIVWAKFYDYSWAVIGSWRSSVAVLGFTGLAMLLFSGFDFANRSILNIAEMVVGVAAIAVATVGIFMTSSVLFYVLAGIVGGLWLVDTARHVYHSVSETPTTYHGHAPVH